MSGEGRQLLHEGFGLLPMREMAGAADQFQAGIRDRSAPALNDAGIQPEDVIVELSGRPVTSAADLEQIAARRPPGQPTSLTVRRGAERKTLILK